MRVLIKQFDVNMEVKNKGIEFEVRDTQNRFLGDCVLTKTSLIWCAGKTSRAQGKSISWDKFIKYMQNQ